jgi:predicted RNA-binding Zn-ribbon protein involved in translation (DUF1610 family)
MPLYHGEEFSIKELCELLGKGPRTTSKLVNDAEQKKIPLERYVIMQEDVTDTGETVGGKPWNIQKADCRRCGKSYTKLGRSNYYCPQCAKRMTYTCEREEKLEKNFDHFA